MPLTKQQKRKNEIIQKEQTQLLMIQKELENISSKINDSINVLKVEELQLKSSAVVFENPHSSSIKVEKATCTPLQITSVRSCSQLFNDIPTTFEDWAQPNSFVETGINRQEVDLDLSRFTNTSQDIEEEDE